MYPAVTPLAYVPGLTPAIPLGFPLSSNSFYKPTPADQLKVNNTQLLVRTRVNFTPNELRVMEKVFEREPVPSPESRRRLADQLDVSQRRIQVWFQNRRARMKKRIPDEVSGDIDDEDENDGLPGRQTSKSVRVSSDEDLKSDGEVEMVDVEDGEVVPISDKDKEAPLQLLPAHDGGVLVTASTIVIANVNRLEQSTPSREDNTNPNS
jgi:hypothetical protein